MQEQPTERALTFCLAALLYTHAPPPFITCKPAPRGNLVVPRGRVPSNGFTWLATRGVVIIVGEGATGGGVGAAIQGTDVTHGALTGVHVAPSIFNMFTAGVCRVNCLG